MSQQTLPFDDARSDRQIVLPINENLLEKTVDLIFGRFGNQLPDLSNVHVILSSNSGITQLRSHFMGKAAELGYQALLGPNIVSLENWTKQHSSLSPTVLSEHARELLLVGALKEFPHIYKQSSPWTLAESLMELFDELTLANLNLPKDIESFKQQISEAYGATDEIKDTLSREAILVHTLWYAMHEQLGSLGALDRISANALRLANCRAFLARDAQLVYCGIDNPAPSEKQWRKEYIQEKQLTLITHDYQDTSTVSSMNNYYQFLNQAFDKDTASFFERIRQCKEQFPDSPVAPHIRLFGAESSEDEALAIDIQVRCWLLEGKSTIGIVTDNRKLARRVRALLERANIGVDDKAGWALSTTSAATVLERWLETVEQDFHYLPLLDFLKSPFVLSSEESFLKAVYQLEQHIIVDSNTPNDIARYLQQIEIRAASLEEKHITVHYETMVSMLNSLSIAAQPLIELVNSHCEHDSLRFIDALMTSLTRLNITDTFEQDAAGQQLLSELGELRKAAIQIPTQMDWLTFRAWLGRTLERFNFKPETIQSPVILTTLADSEFINFDACILAGAEQQFLPHRNRVSPFFNDAVRAALNITTQEEKLSLNYYQFRRLLCAVKSTDSGPGELLITRRITDNGEEIIPSPWISALQSFHQQCYGSDLSDHELAQLITDSRCQVALDDAELPEQTSNHPKVAVPATLIPGSLSASSYQQLVDCPYKFFAARCLQLEPPELVKEALQKVDYGNRVHLCLQAFHGQVKDLPGPFTEKINATNRADAIRLLEEISQTVFSSDIEHNFLHRGWLRRWQKMIPLYIDWQMEQQQSFKPVGTEIAIGKTTIDDHVKIEGKIDRIDQGEDGLAILDYKTGNIHRREDILSGEAVQLPFYLMLLMAENDPRFEKLAGDSDAQVTAFYVDLYDTKKVSSKARIENQELRDCVAENKQRLLTVIQQLHQGIAAPAWGSIDACKHCKMDVLCRKQLWSAEQ